MKDIYVDGAQFGECFPESLNEMPLDILLIATGVYFTNPDKVDAQSKMIWLLSGMKIDEITAYFEQYPEAFAPIAKELGFLDNTHLTVNHFPVLNFGEVNPMGSNPMTLSHRITEITEITEPEPNTLYAPDKNWSNMTFGEFVMCENAFAAYSKTNDSQHLNRLLALLYLPDIRGDKRVVYTDAEMIARQGLIAQMLDSVKVVCYLWYCGVRHSLTVKYANFFSPIPKKGAKSKPQLAKYGWLNMVDFLAKEDVTKYQAVGDVALHEALAKLDMACVEE
jgi:hypothetical protein